MGIRVKNNNGFFKIIVEGELSSKAWGQEWGTVCRTIRSNSTNITTIILDLVDCTWADPFPLLSMGLEFSYYNKDNQIKIMIDLPEINDDDVDYVKLKKARFLNFLDKDGFIGFFNQCADKVVFSDQTKDKLDVILQSYSRKLLRQSREIIRASIYEIKTLEECELAKQDIEKAFINEFKSIVPYQTYLEVFSQVHHIIYELVDNVFFHAYASIHDQKKRFAIYIRTRSGLPKKSRGHYETGETEKFLRDEENRNPALDNGNKVLNASSFLEIFFVDNGIGLMESLRTRVEQEYGINARYTLRFYLEKVLKDGIRTLDSQEDSETFKGGLHFLCNILRSNQSYLWCQEGKEWGSGECEKIITEGIGKSRKESIYCGEYKHPLPGLRFCFRIPFSESSQTENPIAFKWNGKPSNHPAYLQYEELYEADLKINTVCCIDERYGLCLLTNGDPDDWAVLKTDNIARSSGDIDCEKINGIHTIVWFPKDGNTKNDVNKRLAFYTESFIKRVDCLKQVRTLIIADIPSKEHLSYYYALEGAKWKARGLSIFERVILVTDRWEANVLESMGGKLENSKRLSNSFLGISRTGTISNKRNISGSVEQYARFLRKYDSYLFWSLAQEYAAQKVFINADIKWEGTKEIHGFVNFESIYLIEDLYTLLKRVLSRTIAFTENMCVEFLNIDYPSARICMDINATNIFYDPKHISYVSVNAACATGLTKESYYNAKKIDFSVVFFPHFTYTSKDKNTLFLFIWPKYNSVIKFKPESTVYRRLGKTNLITSDKDDKLIDTNSIYSSSIQNKNAAYNEFQDKYAKIIKFGHYRTDHHHYLIAFDLMAYIENCYYKKQGVILYIIAQIVECIKGKEDIGKSINNSEWLRAVSAFIKEHDTDLIKKSSKNRMVVIYHSNTFMEYLMGYVKKIINPVLYEHIIPINIIDIQHRGTPMAISPFVRHNIEDRVKDNDCKDVLFIDSSVSSGRRLLEMNNILMSIGCNNIFNIAVIDMRRLQGADNTVHSYWKVNIPRLDDEASCLICESLERINTIKYDVLEDLAGRIDEWKANWSDISISNNLSEHGLLPEEIINIQIKDGIFKGGAFTITDINTLIMYVTEKLCESYNNDFVLTFIEDHPSLSSSIKLQLICTQLCLFGNQSSKRLQMRLLDELFRNMAERVGVDNYTSLAGLVLIAQSDTILYEYFEKTTDDKSSVFKTWEKILNSENNDLILVLCYYIRNYSVIERLIRKLEKQNPDSKLLVKMNDNLHPFKNIKQLYKEFCGLLVNEYGPRHDVRIEKMKKKVPKFSKAAFEDECHRVFKDQSRLLEIASQLSPADTNGFVIKEGNAIVDSAELLDVLENDFQDLKRCLNRDCFRNTESGGYIANDELIKVLNKCSDHFGLFSKKYILSSNDDIESYFENLARDVQEDKKIYIKTHRDGLYDEKLTRYDKEYYWNRWIEQELIYLLQNVHATVEPIKEEYDMIVNIDFTTTELKITTESFSKVASQNVEHAFKDKNRYAKEQCRAFDVNFHFNSDNIRMDDNTLMYKLTATLVVPAIFPSMINTEK